MYMVYDHILVVSIIQGVRSGERVAIELLPPGRGFLALQAMSSANIRIILLEGENQPLTLSHDCLMT